MDFANFVFFLQGLRYVYKGLKSILSSEFFEDSEILSKIGKNCQKSQFRYLEKGVLELCRAATLKPRKIDHSVFVFTGPQWTKSSLQTGVGSNGGSILEKS